MNRSTLRKILFIPGYGDAQLDAVRAIATDVDIVTASPGDVTREVVDAQVVIGGKLDEMQLRAARELIWHHVPWVGVESIVSPLYAELGITLTNGSGINSANIAEHVIGMMLAFARDLPRFVRDQDQRAWRHWDEDAVQFFDLEGQRIVCLGTGDIAVDVARRLTAFGCDIIGASRSGRAVDDFSRCVTFDHLGAELAEADHIINCLPMTPSTLRIVSAEMIAAMKPGAFFFNVGRGDTVDQDALIAALKSGHLAGAGLDVVSPEPLPEENPLWSMHNVIITSHTSGTSPHAMQHMAELTANQLIRFMAGEQLLNIVDVTSGY